jgi:hypothetical protein
MRRFDEMKIVLEIVETTLVENSLVVGSWLQVVILFLLVQFVCGQISGCREESTACKTERHKLKQYHDKYARIKNVLSRIIRKHYVNKIQCNRLQWISWNDEKKKPGSVTIANTVLYVWTMMIECQDTSITGPK